MKNSPKLDNILESKGFSVNLATMSDVEDIMDVFKKWKDIFPHKRKSHIIKHIEKREVLWENGVVFILATNRKPVKWGNHTLPAGDVRSKGIASFEPGNGHAYGIVEKVMSEVDKHGLSFWVDMRKSNQRSIDFHKKFGCVEYGDIFWADGTIEGIILKREGIGKLGNFFSD